MTPKPHDHENVNDASIRAGMKSLEGKYPVTVRYEKFDRAPYDPEAAVAEFEEKWYDHGDERYGLAHQNNVILQRQCDWLRAALTEAHAAGEARLEEVRRLSYEAGKLAGASDARRDAWLKAHSAASNYTAGMSISSSEAAAKRVEDAARADGVETE